MHEVGAQTVWWGMGSKAKDALSVTRRAAARAAAWRLADLKSSPARQHHAHSALSSRNTLLATPNLQED